jgi:homoaconitase/3-isopropylmalate dehydratase large subunit
MTLTEKLLARAAGKSSLQAGENAWVNADVLMTHDVCGPGTIGVFKREFGADAKVWDRSESSSSPTTTFSPPIPDRTATSTFCAISQRSRISPISTMSSTIQTANGCSIKKKEI